LLCHHAAEVADYRSAQFDALAALARNTHNLPAVLSCLQEEGLQAVVLSGTVFENDEGVGSEPMSAFSPYGLSKGLTWQVFRFHCGQAGVPLGKFVIPNPFGPFEEERFTAYLMRTWRDGKTATVKTPLYVRDNIPVDLLAQVYVGFAERVAAAREGLIKVNPSGYVETQGAFAARVAREVSARVPWSCKLDLARQEDFCEPLKRVNNEPAAALVSSWDEKVWWDGFVRYYEVLLAGAAAA